MSDPILPGQHGQVVDSEGRSTVPWYNWFRLLQAKLVTVTDAVAAIPAATPATVIHPSADIEPYGDTTAGYTLLLSATAKASVSGPMGPAGQDGADGDIGPPGPQGPAGTSSVNGQITPSGAHMLIDAYVADDPILVGTPSSAAAAAGQASIQFEYEGANLGTSGTATEVNFTGAALVASRAADKVTVNVAVTGGGGGTSDIGLVLQLPFTPITL